MRITMYPKDCRFHGEVNINSMTLEEAEILFKTLTSIENPKPFIKALIVNLKKRLFKN